LNKRAEIHGGQKKETEHDEKQKARHTDKDQKYDSPADTQRGGGGCKGVKGKQTTRRREMDEKLDQAVATCEHNAIVNVANVQDRSQALEIGKQIKTRRAEVVEFFRDSKAKAHATWKSIVAQEKSFTDRLDAVELAIKSAVLQYDRKQEAIRQAEQRRLQAEADEAARRERDRLEKQAAKLKTPEKKEALRQQAEAIIAPVVNVAPVAQKTKGVSTRKIWKARVIDAAAVPREWLIVDDKALNGFAKATKGSKKIDGVEFYQEETLNMRRC
jgi:Asp-tRNA(Asn)/Glu-tRNA(Gln) amidotransferase A subunit family amidase